MQLPRGYHRRTVFAEASGGTRTSAVRTALTLRVVFSLPLRQTEGFLDSLLRLMGLNLKAPDHTTLFAPEPNRCGAAPDPIPRRPDRLDRRFHRAEDSGLRRMERAQAQGIKETPGIGGSCTSGWMPRGSLWRPNSQRAAGTTPPHSLLFLDTIEVPIRRFTADGAYDHRSVYDQLSAAGTENVVIVIPPRRSAVSAGPTDGPWAPA